MNKEEEHEYEAAQEMRKEAFHVSTMSWEFGWCEQASRIHCNSIWRSWTEGGEDGGEGEDRRTGTQINKVAFRLSKPMPFPLRWGFSEVFQSRRIWGIETGFSRMLASMPFFSFLASHTPPSNTSASPHSVGQQSSWELKWCLKNNLLILIRPVGRQAKTSWVSSSLCCQQPDDKQSSYCVEKRRALTSRQAGGIKPAMIKGPFSKSLADLHGRTLWSRLKDWKWRWRKWRRTIGGGETIFLFFVQQPVK